MIIIVLVVILGKAKGIAPVRCHIIDDIIFQWLIASRDDHARQ
jgi:hypothetical protein